MRHTSCVVYLSIDEFIPSRGNIVPGLQDFLADLGRSSIPCVWLTSRTRLQIDEPRRKLAHSDPFLAEDGCGLYLPEDYFHLRPKAPRSGRPQPLKTVRLGRFTCLPIAKPQPAAAELLDSLAAETGVSVVALKSLPPRELAQNTGLHPREAELARQRDFDELFFFAGASAKQMEEFQAAAQQRGAQLRSRAALWSLAVGASLSRGIRELARLYDRALHMHARTVGIAVADQAPEFFSACDRSILLTTEDSEAFAGKPPARTGRVLHVLFDSPDKWHRLANYLID